jgi:hypothetical protein
MRSMLPTYLLVIGGFLGGLAIGVFVLDYHPAYLGWLFGGGAGLSVGAFIAALATNTPLVGSPNQRTHRGVIRPTYDDDDDLDSLDDASEAPRR